MSQKLLKSVGVLQRIEQMKLDELRQELGHLQTAQQDFLEKIQVLNVREQVELAIDTDVFGAQTRIPYMETLYACRTDFQRHADGLQEKIDETLADLTEVLVYKKQLGRVAEKTMAKDEHVAIKEEQKNMDEIALSAYFRPSDFRQS